ncbi:MAG TPA: zinc ribbon domain-containing protein [Vicinamibacteria bacterium]|nr:zinc ribbon domain-containing protein [Vicinamibacteria bacterium]
MPLYEYRCLTCGRRFEALRRMGEDSSGLSCPDCGGPELRKEVSTFSGGSGGCGSPSGGRFT